jgi:hypothetical protein
MNDEVCEVVCKLLNYKRVGLRMEELLLRLVRRWPNIKMITPFRGWKSSNIGEQP